jgi:hypothetical protein
MIEVNRRLCMDEQSGAKTEGFAQVRAALGAAHHGRRGCRDFGGRIS